MEITREQRIEAGRVDMETGRFPMVLASEDEASDGHILGIAGLETPERMPMMFGHSSSPDIPVLGSIIEPDKTIAGDQVPILRSTGVFNLNGDDPLAGVRRGIAQLVNDGDLPAVSIRWVGDGVPRVELPEGHPHRVERDADGPERWGMFFETSRALEGSVVAIGADPRALAGRSEAAEDELTRTFFRVLAESPEVHGMVDVSKAFNMLHEAQRELIKVGVSAEDILRLTGTGDEHLVEVTYGDASAWIPVGAYRHLTGVGQDMMRVAFNLAISRDDGPKTATPERVEVIPPEGGKKEAPRGVMDMGVEEFMSGLQRSMADAVYQMTGRRKAK